MTTSTTTPRPKGSRPASFPGPCWVVEANQAPHWFDIEGRCRDCDCCSWGWTVEWPCGFEPPRVGL